MVATVRPAAVAGSWYPGTAKAIVEEVDRYLDAAGAVDAPGRLVALVSPHAGLRYSGPVAAHGYGLLREDPGRRRPTVVLVGPSHRAAFDGVAAHARGAWDTPLGRAPIDEELARAILDADPVVFDDPDVHRDEHSLEMQMPFLQRLVPGLRIVPLLMGSQSREEVEALAGALGEGPGRPATRSSSPRAISRTTSRPPSPTGRTRWRSPRWSASTRRPSWPAWRSTGTSPAAGGRWSR